MTHNTYIDQLEPGKTYEVITEFKDHQGNVHPVGEVWTFIGTNFVPYYSGMCLFVLKDGAERMYMFQSEPEEQRDLLNDFMNYVKRV